jgi:uncharacterized membrane protein YjfL (UPF0719 family)
LADWDFDADEFFFFFVAGALTLRGAAYWYPPLWRRVAFRRSMGIRVVMAATPAVALAILWLVLSRWADPSEVVGHLDYQLLFLAGGTLWLWTTAVSMQLLGIHPIDDALDRSNPAAAAAVAGALLGSMAVYAGANIGSGATIWTTVFPAFVATVVWLVLWAVVEAMSSPSEAITVERDLAAGIRHGGWLVASGMVLGRSVAGDFVSWDATFSDLLRMAWPAVPLAMGAVALHLRLRPTEQVPHPKVFMAGVLPAAFFVVLAVGYMIELATTALHPAEMASFR